MEVTERESSDEKRHKVIQIPIFEKVELKRCENPWVRPILMEKNLSKNERKMKVGLFVRHLLFKHHFNQSIFL